MPNFRASRRGAVVAATAAGLLVAASLPAHAASVQVAPTSGVNPAGQAVTVRGSGFDPVRNNKFGVYVVFGPRRPDWTSNSNAYLAANWVHPGGSGGGQARMSPSGGFSVTLSVKAKYTDGDGRKVDCLATQCYVITMAAHGVPDRSQDTFTPIRFKGSGTGSGPGSATGPGGTANSAGSGQGRAASGSGPGAQGVPGASATGGPSGTASPSATPDGASLAGASPAGAFEQTASGGRAASPWPFWAATAAAAAAALIARTVLRRRSARSGRRRDLGHSP
ncbi:hypothetical protein E1287_12655 [Actinomadura sp. KC06]|uniref:hypothetical protein n=1 Tax=Actinomadura sp. KC06 TaxID=2530369 RepID=UPI001051C543|nr:hypothetical protein [Actinomadura sp. KC06]TDD35832.1 hypothetical protein E1287_12655 [Actinomadura sp. KC06]